MAFRRKRRAAGTGHFMALPDVVIESPGFAHVSGVAIKALLIIGKQYTGKNNGALRGTYSVLRAHGFRSKGTSTKALTELTRVGLLVITRHGGLHMGSTLYALGWHPIDDNPKARLEMGPTIKPASSEWRDPAEVARIIAAASAAKRVRRKPVLRVCRPAGVRTSSADLTQRRPSQGLQADRSAPASGNGWIRG